MEDGFRRIIQKLNPIFCRTESFISEMDDEFKVLSYSKLSYSKSPIRIIVFINQKANERIDEFLKKSFYETHLSSEKPEQSDSLESGDAWISHQMPSGCLTRSRSKLLDTTIDASFENVTKLAVTKKNKKKKTKTKTKSAVDKLPNVIVEHVEPMIHNDGDESILSDIFNFPPGCHSKNNVDELNSFMLKPMQKVIEPTDSTPLTSKSAKVHMLSSVSITVNSPSNNSVTPKKLLNLVKPKYTTLKSLLNNALPSPVSTSIATNHAKFTFDEVCPVEKDIERKCAVHWCKPRYKSIQLQKQHLINLRIPEVLFGSVPVEVDLKEIFPMIDEKELSRRSSCNWE